MKIKYVHSSESDKVKIYDTVTAYEKLPRIFKNKTQTEFDLHELDKMREDKARGVILSFEVIEEETKPC